MLEAGWSNSDVFSIWSGREMLKTDEEEAFSRYGDEGGLGFSPKNMRCTLSFFFLQKLYFYLICYHTRPFFALDCRKWQISESKGDSKMVNQCFKGVCVGGGVAV